MSSGRRVVVVDDDLKVVILVSKAMAELGFEVFSAEDGGKALELVKKEKAHLLITDILQPGLDGTQLCQAVQQDPETEGTYIIVMSGVYQESMFRSQMECKTQGFLEKPIDVVKLKQLVNEMFAGD